MPAYWWSCIKCGKEESFPGTCECNSIHGFIWKQLLPSQWDQQLLKKRCPRCGLKSLRITYEFPRQNKEVVYVNHIVGLDRGDWIPMMWETVFSSKTSNRLYDFKYLGQKNIWGLNKPAVFTEDTLRQVVKLYREKSGRGFKL